MRRWLADQVRALKPTTARDYTRYVERDIIPGLGHVALQQLRRAYVSALIEGMEAAGRGATAIRRCIATLSSALGDAVADRQLSHNPAQRASLTKVDRTARPERPTWSPEQAVRRPGRRGARWRRMSRPSSPCAHKGPGTTKRALSMERTRWSEGVRREGIEPPTRWLGVA
jgi:hypothetical protein